MSQWGHQGQIIQARRDDSMKNIWPTGSQGQKIKVREDDSIYRVRKLSSSSYSMSATDLSNRKDVKQKVSDILEGDAFKVRDQCGVVLLCLSPEVVVVVIVSELFVSGAL